MKSLNKPNKPKKKPLENIKIGYALTGSFCTFAASKVACEALVEAGASVTPIFSYNAASMNTRFGNAKTHMEQFERICGNPPIATIENAEPIGPKEMFDIVVVAPCTGNTAAKLALGITDTPVTMAVKSHIRNNRPVLIAMSTNDALSAAAKNIGILLNYRNYYFVPLSQNDTAGKPRSCVADFSQMVQSVNDALSGKQSQPLIFFNETD
ncbi:MAG: dipicolinate synthase subunit B [Ruminococcus sp.]|jgi:dipicolinate synthase subunit B|nr:dipicolinate synthase subunit B [Ruminococcus sp.]